MLRTSVDVIFRAPAEGCLRSERKSTRLNSSHTDIYTLSLHDALPISVAERTGRLGVNLNISHVTYLGRCYFPRPSGRLSPLRTEEHTSELQPHRHLHSFPTRRSSDLGGRKDRSPWCKSQH